MSGQIFISYRREESQWSARSLHDRLCRDFDPKQIFMDIDAIALGEDFVKAIESTVAKCDVLIAVIGNNWLTSKDDHGDRRLDNPEDFVRMEIGTALKREIRVIPVLVDGAIMPRADELPEDLKPLVRRNALAITGTSFAGDCQRLATEIRQVLEKVAAEGQERLAAEARQKEEKERLEAERSKRPQGTSWSLSEPQVEAERTFASDSKLSVPFGVIQNMLQKGRVIPFLGSDLALVGRAEGATWMPGESQFPPTRRELARYLAEVCGFPRHDDLEQLELEAVASYFTTLGDPESLKAQLHKIYARDLLITPLHRYLAELPSPVLIVTTNYDNLTEKAFDAASHPYDLVVQDLTRYRKTGAFLVKKYGHDEFEAVAVREISLSPTKLSVIYKMYGSVVSSDSSLDTYVITEDDHVRLLSRILGVKLFVPHHIVEWLGRSTFLFLGCGLRDWTFRQLFRCLTGYLSTARSWAIRSNPSETEKPLWNAHEITFYSLDLLEFVSGLRVFSSGQPLRDTTQQ